MRTGNILIGNLKGKDSLSSCRKTIMKILSINIWPFQKQTGQNCSFSTGSILVYKKLNNMGKIQTFSCFWLKKKKWDWACISAQRRKLENVDHTNMLYPRVKSKISTLSLTATSFCLSPDTWLVNGKRHVSVSQCSLSYNCTDK